MTELGEGASVTPVKETPGKYLHARIVEVTFSKVGSQISLMSAAATN
jgi:hypothetical protein